MRHFFSELDRLQSEIVQMGQLVRSAVRRSVCCLTDRNPDFAEQVFRDERLINTSEIAIDELAISLVTLNQPVASDMRLIVAALKINTDLERMGDLAVNIARKSTSLIEAAPLEPAVPIPAISKLVEEMVEHAIAAFTNRDESLARTVMAADDEVDRIRNEIYEDLSARMEKDPTLVRRALGHVFVARNLERIADHATNIAEDVIFMVKGIDVRHQNDRKN